MRRAIQGVTRPGKIVAVLASHFDLEKAARLRRLPDLFELRLDALCHDLPAVERMLRELRAPLIITARHPAEGGLHDLSASRRRALLEQFLPHAAYVDIELRAAHSFRSILDAAHVLHIQRIISVHDFRNAPTAQRLDQWAAEAQSLRPDILKIVTGAEDAAQLEVLAEFFERSRAKLALSIMGVGRLGRKSRLYFAQHGSALNYAHLGNSQIAGQLSLLEMRRALTATTRRRNSAPSRFDHRT